jgi:signal transduction histidine kinase
MKEPPSAGATTQQDLLQQIEELRQSQRHLLTIASHDVKSPFNRMHALLQLLQMSSPNLTDEQKNYLEKMHIVVADGMAMIRNLIDYRNLEFQDIALSPAPFTLREFVHTSLKAVEGLALKKQLILTASPVTAFELYTDRHCLQRAFDNLLSNAVKFSFPGKTVRVQAIVSGTTVTLAVQDEALGFLQEEQARLFQKFSKFSTRPTGGESSTGLGLYIARAMMQKINGRVECETTQGTGSVFRILFPAALK